MSKNFIHSGNTLTLTAPVGGVVGGKPVKIGSLVVIPTVSVAAGLPFEGNLAGAYTCDTDTGTAWAECDTLYWDAANSRFTKTSAGNTKCAVAAAVKPSGDASAPIRLIPTI